MIVSELTGSFEVRGMPCTGTRMLNITEIRNRRRFGDIVIVGCHHTLNAVYLSWIRLRRLAVRVESFHKICSRLLLTLMAYGYDVEAHLE